MSTYNTRLKSKIQSIDIGLPSLNIIPETQPDTDITNQEILNTTLREESFVSILSDDLSPPKLRKSLSNSNIDDFSRLKEENIRLQDTVEQLQYEHMQMENAVLKKDESLVKLECEMDSLRQQVDLLSNQLESLKKENVHLKQIKSSKYSCIKKNATKEISNAPQINKKVKNKNENLKTNHFYNDDHNLDNLFLNDEDLTLYFNHFKRIYSKSDVEFIEPSLSSLLKFDVDVSNIVASRKLKKRSYLIIPVNDNELSSNELGSHWSLLIFSKNMKTFFYLDSYNVNISHAKKNR